MKKILIINLKRKKFSFNSELHIDWFSYMQKFLKIYCLELCNNNKIKNNFIIDKKNYKNQFLKIINKINPEYILVYNSGNSTNFEEYKLYFEILKKIKIKKIFMCSDYFRFGIEKEEVNRIVSANFNSIIFRHKISLDIFLNEYGKNNNIKSYWLPYSFDKDLYHNNSIKKFKNKSKKASFVGSGEFFDNSKAGLFRNNLYKKRINVINGLNSKNLISLTDIDGPQRKKLPPIETIRFATKNMIGLTCGGTCDFFVAKYIQIPASYQALFCANTVGLEIFPENSYILFDDNIDYSIEKVIYYLNNIDKLKNIQQNLTNHVYKNHTHFNRYNEFLKIIEEK